MRIALEIDEDVLAGARERALREGRTVGAVMSELARRGLAVPKDPAAEVAEPAELHGFAPLPRRGAVVTNALIDRLLNEDIEE